MVSLMNLGLGLSTYPANLQVCIAQAPLVVIREHYMSVLLSFPECLTNKLVVTASNVLGKLSSAYQSVMEKFTRDQISDISDIRNQILFSLEDSVPVNQDFISDFLRNKEYPNLNILQEQYRRCRIEFCRLSQINKIMRFIYTILVAVIKYDTDVLKNFNWIENDVTIEKLIR